MEAVLKVGGTLLAIGAAVFVPVVAGRLTEFRASSELASVPSLRYPALLRGALATSRNRKAKSGDGYDIDHLTRGLSHCDVVTADSGMVHLVEEHGLAPSGYQVIRTGDRVGLQGAIKRRLARSAHLCRCCRESAGLPHHQQVPNGMDSNIARSYSRARNTAEQLGR